jgi:hypothetical protein
MEPMGKPPLEWPTLAQPEAQAEARRFVAEHGAAALRALVDEEHARAPKPALAIATLLTAVDPGRQAAVVNGCARSERGILGAAAEPRHPPGMRPSVLLAAALTLILAACNETSARGAASAPPSDTSAEPALTIDPADAKCSSNADCGITMTQCSCDCGSPVNVAHAKKYEEARERMCKDYQGPMCKMACNETASCDGGVCRIKK